MVYKVRDQMYKRILGWRSYYRYIEVVKVKGLVWNLSGVGKGRVRD